MLRRVVATIATLACLMLPVGALAHNERPAANPTNADSIAAPSHRTIEPSDTNVLVVCKSNSSSIISAWPSTWSYLKDTDNKILARCKYHDLQAAVDAVPHSGTTIAILPGTYLEKPSLDTSSWTQHCKDLLANVATAPNISYADQLACPHVTQEVAILGDPDSVQRGLTDGSGGYDCDGRLCKLQIEGMGRIPTEVVFDNQFHRLNAIRADRAFGVYFRNFTVEHTEFNGLYVIEVDGYVIDSVLGRWNLEYGFLSFTSDHGLWKNCEAYGNGDSGLYPGGQAQRFGLRPSVEVTGCSAHHNTAGTSGTAGDSVYFHDNVMYDNMTGIANDSLAAHHPGTPQNSGVYIHNHVFSNNENFYYYARTVDPNDAAQRTYCNRPTSQIDYEHGVVCPSFVFPVGVGIMLAGGNFNVYSENWISDNWRTGTLLFTVPAELRGDNTASHQLDNSHANRYYQNRMGFDPTLTSGGTTHPNGLDFYWDEGGVLNCWQYNVPAAGHQIFSDPPYDTGTPGNGPPGPPPDLGGRPTGSPDPSKTLPVCFPPDQPSTSYAPSSTKASLYAGCALYDLHTQNDPADCAWDRQSTAPPDYVSTGFGLQPGQQVLPAGRAPSGWSLGWVNPPAGAIAEAGRVTASDTGVTEALIPAVSVIALVLIGAWLRVARIPRGRVRRGSRQG